MFSVNERHDVACAWCYGGQTAVTSSDSPEAQLWPELIWSIRLVCLVQFVVMWFWRIYPVGNTSQLDQLFCKARVSVESFWAPWNERKFNYWLCWSQDFICSLQQLYMWLWIISPYGSWNCVSRFSWTHPASLILQLHRGICVGVLPKENPRGTPAMYYQADKAYVSSAEIAVLFHI